MGSHITVSMPGRSPAPRFICWKKSATSSSLKALPSDSMGTLCCTLPKPCATGAPTLSDGESARRRSGKRASIASRRRFSAS